jgi:predicted nucleotidyltransferase
MSGASVSPRTAPSLEQIGRVVRPLLPAAYRAVLFGSRATGRSGPASDWDVGLLGPAPLGGDVVERVREALDELPTLHTFDVVDLATVSEEFRAAALRNAVALP